MTMPRLCPRLFVGPSSMFFDVPLPHQVDAPYKTAEDGKVRG